MPGSSDDSASSSSSVSSEVEIEVPKVPKKSSSKKKLTKKSSSRTSRSTGTVKGVKSSGSPKEIKTGHSRKSLPDRTSSAEDGNEGKPGKRGGRSTKPFRGDNEESGSSSADEVAEAKVGRRRKGQSKKGASLRASSDESPDAASGSAEEPAKLKGGKRRKKERSKRASPRPSAESSGSSEDEPVKAKREKRRPGKSPKKKEAPLSSSSSGEEPEPVPVAKKREKRRHGKSKKKAAPSSSSGETEGSSGESSSSADAESSDSSKSDDNGRGDRKGKKKKSSKKKSLAVDEHAFNKLKLIGRGAVGHVYLVERISDGKLYAMKVLDKKEMRKRNKIKRALTEREILATADHPFIVTLYWSFQSKDKLYFVMDYCAGGEFFRYLQTQPGKCLPESSVRFYAAEVLLALEYLHFQGFVYRDLKPENILLHSSGHLMLTDFDLSKAAATGMTPQMVQGMFSKVEGLYNNPQLSTTSFVGTTEYIAPEVIQGFGQSSAVDWWTLGILIFEMLFGRTPFRDDSNNQTLKNILDKGVKIPKENHHGKISSDCKNFIKKLLHTNPKKRLGSKKGAIDIKKQDWFEDVNFPLIRNETPPFVPKMSSKHDTRHFRAHLDERELSNSSESESSGAEFDEFADVERNPRHPGAKAE